MKLSTTFVFCAFAGAARAATLQGEVDDRQTPIVRVLNLVRDLKVGVEYDGKQEQKTYDKYACWCEATLERKAKDISDAKALVDHLRQHILKLKGEIGAHDAEIASLKKWVGENQAAQKDATDLRDKQNAEFELKKVETEQCIGALESAIKTLTGAGEGKGAGFLEMQQAQFMSTAQVLRRVLSHAAATEHTSSEDLHLLSSFLEKPADFAAAQTGHKSPFGEYAPASTKLQGILKGMYDAFVADLEKTNADESNSQKSFEEYIATKQSELNANQQALEAHELDKATKAKDESDSQIERDDTQEQSNEDEKYFELTKQGCREKAMEWNERSRLRSEELVGINQAIEILESPESQQLDAARGARKNETLLTSRQVTLLQLGRVSIHSGKDHGTLTYKLRVRAVSKIAKLAKRFGSLNLAQIASALQSGGHFDKVIKMMDDMIAVLRKEEQSDIKHRDLCQNSIAKNTADMADAQTNMQKATATVNEMTVKVQQMDEEIKELERLQSQTKTDMDEKLEMRNKEREYFEESIKDDVQAIDVINKAMKSLMNAKETHAFLQQGPGPEYTVDSDKAPELAERKDRSKQTAGIITILETLVTDIENDVAAARKEDDVNQKAYGEERQALKDLLHAQMAGVVAAEQSIADAEAEMNTAKGHFLTNEKELEAQQMLQSTLSTDCDWVAKEFDSRRTARKAEVDGLQNAKGILAGAATGDSASSDELALDGAQ